MHHNCRHDTCLWVATRLETWHELLCNGSRRTIRCVKFTYATRIKTPSQPMRSHHDCELVCTNGVIDLVPCKVSADSTLRCEVVHQHRCRVKLISLIRRNHRHTCVVALPLETRSRHSPSLVRTLGGRREGKFGGLHSQGSYRYAFSWLCKSGNACQISFSKPEMVRGCSDKPWMPVTLPTHV